MKGQKVVFLAYPSAPKEVGDILNSTARRLRGPSTEVKTWEQSDIAGQFIATAILQEIDHCDVLVADITRLNFNVTFEIGFAIGRGKCVIPVVNCSLQNDAEMVKSLGIFDTIGITYYENSQQAAELISAIDINRTLLPSSGKRNYNSPVFLLGFKHKTDNAARIIARVNKAKLNFRSFDPIEQPRLAAHEAINGVAESYGILVTLLPAYAADAELNNLRGAFVAGLSQGMERPLLLLQDGDTPVPLDYRDLVRTFFSNTQIDEYIGEFATRTVGAMQAAAVPDMAEPVSLLETISLGASSAENELRDLHEYYLETAEYTHVVRGEARIVSGRKGTGKTAVFARVSDRIRRDVRNVVIDLKPEGYRLLRLKESIAELLTAGTLEHTFTALWEYLLYVEIGLALLSHDATRHLRDHRIATSYRKLSETICKSNADLDGDFSERIAKLMHAVREEYLAKYGEDYHKALSEGEVTALIHRHDLRELKQVTIDYVQNKGALWILFDNLDKGWPAHGLNADDLVVIRTLLEATRKIERDFQRADRDAHSIVLLRSDVFELLLEEMPDRGKESRVSLDWKDPELLKEVIKRRLAYSGLEPAGDFNSMWRQICVSHIEGEESFHHLLDRCLMRPRFLIVLIEYCRSHAVNLGKAIIDAEDIQKGIETYSADLLVDLGYEMQDISPELEDVLYAFIGVASQLSQTDYELVLLLHGVEDEKIGLITRLMLWYGVLGVVMPGGEERFIFDTNYSMKILEGLIQKAGGQTVSYTINRALWPILQIRNEAAH